MQPHLKVPSHLSKITSNGTIGSMKEIWLPKQKSASSQNVLGDVDIVEGFNDCLKKIKSKLR